MLQPHTVTYAQFLCVMCRKIHYILQIHLVICNVIDPGKSIRTKIELNTVRSNKSTDLNIMNDLKRIFKGPNRTLEDLQRTYKNLE